MEERESRRRKRDGPRQGMPVSLGPSSSPTLEDKTKSAGGSRSSSLSSTPDSPSSAAAYHRQQTALRMAQDSSPDSPCPAPDFPPDSLCPAQDVLREHTASPESPDSATEYLREQMSSPESPDSATEYLRRNRQTYPFSFSDISGSDDGNPPSQLDKSMHELRLAAGGDGPTTRSRAKKPPSNATASAAAPPKAKTARRPSAPPKTLGNLAEEMLDTMLKADKDALDEGRLKRLAEVLQNICKDEKVKAPALMTENFSALPSKEWEIACKSTDITPDMFARLGNVKIWARVQVEKYVAARSLKVQGRVKGRKDYGNLFDLDFDSTGIDFGNTAINLERELGAVGDRGTAGSSAILDNILVSDRALFLAEKLSQEYNLLEAHTALNVSEKRLASQATAAALLSGLDNIDEWRVAHGREPSTNEQVLIADKAKVIAWDTFQAFLKSKSATHLTSALIQRKQPANQHPKTKQRYYRALFVDYLVRRLVINQHQFN